MKVKTKIKAGNGSIRNAETSRFIMAADEGPGTRLTWLHGRQTYLQELLEGKVPNSLLLAAWDNFYRVYDNLIRRFAIAQGVDRSNVDDCVQEVWSEVVTRLVEFDRPTDRPGLRAWLYVLVRSKATDIFRSKARRPAVSLDQRKLAGHEPRATHADPATLFEQRWEQATVESILAEFCKEISLTNSHMLYMRLIDRRSVREIASELNLAPQQVYARQHRMMKKLRARVSLYIGSPIGF